MSTHTALTYIVGPTGVGKSDFAIELAQKNGAEIISADAYQVYKGLDIGTAKVSADQQALVTHHLIDIKSPNEAYSVVEFLALTEALISSGKPLILCGGSGLFAKSFLYRYSFPPKAKSDPAVRQALEQDYDRLGKEALWERLNMCDPDTAERIHPNNKHHLIRALEIIQITGDNPSDVKHQANSIRTDTQVIGLTAPRSVVVQRISDRVDKMIQLGLIDEVASLLAQGALPESQSMQGIGYKDVIAYLHGRITKEKMIDCIKVQTHQFSKRQMTWFRKIENVHWKTIRY